MRKRILFGFFLWAVFLLAGCSMRTVEQLYCLPKRPQAYNDLQSVMDTAMVGMDYCAPLSGENRQTVQMADLDGDGIREYLLFAKGGDDSPLKVLIFQQQEQNYVLQYTLGSDGSAFDRVEYVQMDGAGGMELVVGHKVSDQVPRGVTVYTFRDGQPSQMLTTSYTSLLTCDLNADSRQELMVLRPGDGNTDKAVAQLYTVTDGSAERSKEVFLSGPTDRLKRMILGNLHGGTPAVFVCSMVDENAIITDVFSLVDGVFTNVSFSNMSGTSVQTLRNYYVYADDLDEDGEVELPSLVAMKPVEETNNAGVQHLIRWYALGPDGSETDKQYTYHNFAEGWFLTLDESWASRISVVQQENAYSFYLWDSHYANPEKIFTVFMLTGQNRQEQAVQDNRFVIYEDETTVYAAHLEVASGVINLSREALTEGFHPIYQDWKTGEM